MGRQERGNRRRCTSCTGMFTYSTLVGTKLVNNSKCPTCEAADRVMKTLDRIRAQNEALDV